MAWYVRAGRTALRLSVGVPAAGLAVSGARCEEYGYCGPAAHP